MEALSSNWRDVDRIIQNQSKVKRAKAELDRSIRAFEEDCEAFDSQSMRTLLASLKSIQCILNEGDT